MDFDATDITVVRIIRFAETAVDKKILSEATVE